MRAIKTILLTLPLIPCLLSGCSGEPAPLPLVTVTASSDKGSSATAWIVIP